MASRSRSLPVNFSVATFNLCNLQQAGKILFGEFAWTPTQYQRKAGWTAEQLRANPATLFAFQEVWSAASLQDVFSTAGMADYQLICHSDDNSMHVAAAVQRDWEVISAEWISAFPPELSWQSDDTRYEMAVQIDRFSRPLLKLRLRGPDARTLTLFNAHLKSRLPVPPGNNKNQTDSYYGTSADHWLDIGRALAGMRRIAEAAVLRILVNRQLAQSTDAVIVAGDCNDRYPGNVIDVLKGDARFRRTSNNRSGRRADWGLYHLLDLAADRKLLQTNASDYITFNGDDEQLALDHLLFSWHFHARAADCRWRLQDWHVHGKHLGSGKPYVSDHAMITTCFSNKS